MHAVSVRMLLWMFNLNPYFIRGVHLDPTFRFSRIMSKRGFFFFSLFSLFWGNSLNIGYASFGEKNIYGQRHFTLISINVHYCAMSQNLFWPPFLNIIFFSIFIFKNATFWAKFYWNFFGESGFSFQGLVKWLFSRKTKIHFLVALFETKHFFLYNSFCW